MVFHFNSILNPGFLKDKFVKINLFFSILGNILTWVWLMLQSGEFDEVISLHYNIYFGIDLIGPWYYILFLPIAGLVIFLLNFILGSFIFNLEKLLSYFLVASSTLVQFLLFISSILIVTINL